MKKILLIIIVSIFFSGCMLSPVKYNSDKDDTKKYDQYIEHTECSYMIGSFGSSDKSSLKQIISNTIKKGNDMGMYGNQLINIDIQEGLFTGIITSKLCVYVKGNIVYSDE